MMGHGTVDPKQLTTVIKLIAGGTIASLQKEGQYQTVHIPMVNTKSNMTST